LKSLKKINLEVCKIWWIRSPRVLWLGSLRDLMT